MFAFPSRSLPTIRFSPSHAPPLATARLPGAHACFVNFPGPGEATQLWLSSLHWRVFELRSTSNTCFAGTKAKSSPRPPSDSLDTRRRTAKMVDNGPNGDREGERGASRKASKILCGARTILRDVEGIIPSVWRMSRLFLWRSEGRSENLPGGILFVPRKPRIGIPPRRRCNVHDPPGL